MKTRRKGGASFLEMIGLKSATPATSGQPTPGQPITEATPLPEGKEMPEAMLSPEAQVLTAPTPEETPSGNATVDKAVSDLYHLGPQFQNYHMRGIINAIGVCNSTEKARNNLVGVTTGTFEAIQCGPQCKVRSEKVKAALKELLRIGEGNDALGYIGSGRVAVNSAAYLGNSAVSLGNKLYNTGAYLGNTVSTRLFTPRAPAQATPVVGGRRRRTRRRR
jgi:hypothetical protein